MSESKSPPRTNQFKQLEDHRRRLLEGIKVPESAGFIVDEFQRTAISQVTNGLDTLVVAPTGSGKTYIAFESIAAALQQGKRAVYTTPLKALSNTKYNELKIRFEPEWSVGLLTGDRKIETNADVVVATTEIFRNELYAASERYSVVVLDEVHFIADPQRGPVWEESIILAPSSATLLMLSASISNAEEIAQWIQEVRGKECRIVSKSDRPVELRYGFIHPDFGILPLRDANGRVLKEVVQFYENMVLDPSGMRLRRKGFRGPPRGKSSSHRSRRR